VEEDEDEPHELIRLVGLPEEDDVEDDVL